MSVILIIIVFFVLYASSAEAATSVTESVLGSLTGNDSQDNTGSSNNDTGVNVYSSDGSLTGSVITSNPATWPGDDKVWNICAAVALAEGYNLGKGTAPYDLNNPGDLSPGDEAGQATAGGAQVHDGSAIVCFATAEGGWRALYAKFSNIVNGHSHVYPASFSWKQIAAKYAGDSVPWLNNVTNYLGVDPASTPAQYVNS